MKSSLRAGCLMTFFGCFGFATPALAQGPDLSIGSIAIAPLGLKIYPKAPSWLSFWLPNSSRELKPNQHVELLGERSYNTIFGQDKWFRVRPCNTITDKGQCTEWAEGGWVLGKDDGNLLLDPSDQE